MALTVACCIPLSWLSSRAEFNFSDTELSPGACSWNAALSEDEAGRLHQPANRREASIRREHNLGKMDLGVAALRLITPNSKLLGQMPAKIVYQGDHWPSNVAANPDVCSGA